MMKKLSVMMVGILSLAASLTARPAWAEASRNEFNVGPEIYYYRYEEPDVDVQIDGAMVGLAAAFTHHHSNQWMFRAEGSSAVGAVDYDGTGTIDDVTDWTMEGRLLGGYDFPVGQDRTQTLTPFFGFGYRYLNDDSSGETSSTGARGYERESNYFYSPIGLEFVTPMNDQWKMVFSGEFDIFWMGEQESHLSDANPSFNDFTNDQDSGYGVRGSMDFVKKGEKVDWIFGPFIRWWSIDDSDRANVTFSGTLIAQGFEPANETLEVGGAVKLKF